MKQDVIDSISKMIVNGNRLDLPQNNHFKNYAAVKKCLITAGVKYKKCGFEFSGDAQEVKDRLCGGEVINDKKKFQFFATPDHLAIRLVGIADIHPHHRCLEPSAGRGAIAKHIIAASGNCEMVELMPENCKVLTAHGYHPHNRDFLTINPETFGYVDRIVANPPFTKNQDIDHIRHMFSFLKPGGKLVSIASTSCVHGSQNKQTDFVKWLDEIGATITEIPAGEFKSSGTNVASVLIEATRR